MKGENAKIINAFVILVVVILLLSVVVPGAVQAEEGEDEYENDTDGYIVREPIRIDGNDDFAAQAAAEGWPGDGSEGNPYVIEGYEINGTGYGYGIYVGNTTVHFVVRGCYVHNASGTVYHGREYNTRGDDENYKSLELYNPRDSGLCLYNAQNGRLEGNNLFRNRGNGIRIYTSNNNIITKNVILNSSYAAIGIYDSNNNIITKNTVFVPDYYTCGLSSYSNSQGMSISNSNNNLISSNTLYSEITTNYSTVKGIDIGLSKNNVIINNNISKFGIGISVTNRYSDPHTNEINNNNFSDNLVDIEYDYYVNETEIKPILFIIVAVLIATALIIISLVVWKKKKMNKKEE